MASEDKQIELSKALDTYQASLAIDGDRRALELLYKRWHSRLLRFALRQTKNPDQAQDVMQDAAITIAKNISKLKNPERFSAWAYTIVRRRSIDMIRHNIRDRAIKENVKSEPSNSQPLDIEARLDLKQALNDLADTDRELLTLFYVDGMSGPELSAALGLPLGTIKSRLFTARSKLKLIYDNQKEGGSL